MADGNYCWDIHFRKTSRNCLLFFKTFILYEQFQIIFFLLFGLCSMCSIYTHTFGKTNNEKKEALFVSVCNCFFTCSLLKKPKMRESTSLGDPFLMYEFFH